jgi:hypothetical protein
MGTSPNPRWLVKFDGQPYKDEEMYEHAFLRRLKSAEDEDGAVSSSSTGSSGGRRQSATLSRPNETRKSGISSEDDDRIGEEKKDDTTEMVMSQSYDEAHAGSESETEGHSMSQAAKDRVSAREARSKRRQAKIDDDVTPAEWQAAGKGTHQLDEVLKNKRQRGDDGEVIQVKLLTGTLFLYRGKQRRVEFVRRV